MATLVKYGVFKYGEVRYGGGLIAEESLAIQTTYFAVRLNTTTHTFIELNDSLTITESPVTAHGNHENLTDSIIIASMVRALYGDHTPYGEHPPYGGGDDIVVSVGYTLELADSIDIITSLFVLNHSGVKHTYISPADSLSFTDSLVGSTGYKRILSDSVSFSESMTRRYGWGKTLSDTLAISESVGNRTSIRLSDSISISVSSIGATLTEGKTLKTNWRFLIRTKTGQYVASLVNARSRWFKEALNHGGSAGFILDTEDTNCNSTILAINSNELIIQYKGYDMWGGQISTVRKVASGNNRYWEVTCSSFFDLLAQRYCGYNKSTGLSDIRAFTTTDAGTIAWTLIHEAQLETYGSLGITQGVIQSSLSRTKSYEKKNIAEAIIELADNDYGFDFEITTDKVFNVFYPFKGTTRDDVIFRYPGNCLEMESMENGLDVVNSELGLGKNWGGQEISYVADDVTSQVAYGRREKIASYKDVEIQAYLTDMVTEDVNWNKDINKVIKFKSFIDRKSDLYMYELGDSVRVIADAFNLDEQLFVYERQVTIDEADNPVVNLTLGD